MTEYATSADGTRIAFERFGSGHPIILLGGMLSDREGGRAYAEALADRFTSVIVDRRGRGDSGDTPPYDVVREVEDVAALIETVGGRASVYGHSSGAGLAFRAAAAGVPMTALVLYEPPFGADDEESRRQSAELARAVRTSVAEGRFADAIGVFLTSVGLPPDAVTGAQANPGMLGLAHTMPYDHAVMGDESDGGVIPTDLAEQIGVPTLLLAGGASAPFFRDTAQRMADLIPGATYRVLEGQDHAAAVEAVVPVVAEFVASAAGAAERDKPND